MENEMNRTSNFLVATLFLLTLSFVLGVFELPRACAHSYPNAITAVSAKAKADAGKAVLIDVREDSEIADGMAAPAEWYAKSKIDENEIAFTKHLGGFSGKEIILYCRSGKRASVVIEKLATQGIKAWNMGGYSDWVAAGFQTKRQKK